MQSTRRLLAGPCLALEVRGLYRRHSTVPPRGGPPLARRRRTDHRLDGRTDCRRARIAACGRTPTMRLLVKLSPNSIRRAGDRRRVVLPPATAAAAWHAGEWLRGLRRALATTVPILSSYIEFFFVALLAPEPD